MNELQFFGAPSDQILTALFEADIRYASRVERVDSSIISTENPEAIKIVERAPEVDVIESVEAESVEVIEKEPEDRELSTLYICDTSGSNQFAMQKIAAYLSNLEKRKHLNYGLILFGTNPDSPFMNAYMHRITDCPNKMAQIFLTAPAGGLDAAGALYSALHVARDHLRSVNSIGTEVVVMSDVAPVNVEEAAFHHELMVEELLRDGHTLKFVKSKPSQNTSWIRPNTFIVEEL
jgi:hypothetical protein